ncbi:hypothetical protein llap_14405 [Limosa lapponica baueri]|uniref:Uncharacterized protein n=1 Tax=Limosa lapponica baueri TaxID=1758121 RepID=A0A2I0TN93_LIMLA|nr:hypothetical protein llap_14405 [Limosa lapponica baueri]
MPRLHPEALSNSNMGERDPSTPVCSSPFLHARQKKRKEKKRKRKERGGKKPQNLRFKKRGEKKKKEKSNYKEYISLYCGKKNKYYIKNECHRDKIHPRPN